MKKPVPMGSGSKGGPVPPGAPQQVKLTVDLPHCNDLKCTKCGGVFFVHLTRYKIVSAIQSPIGKEQLVQVDVIKCDLCGGIQYNESVDGPKKDEKNTNKKG